MSQTVTMFDQLLRNKTIRNYLDRFSECNWESAIKFTLIIGIQNLMLNAQLSDVSIEKLQSLILANSTLLSVDESIPELRHRLNQLHLDIVPKQPSKSSSISSDFDQVHPRHTLHSSVVVDALPGTSKFTSLEKVGDVNARSSSALSSKHRSTSSGRSKKPMTPTERMVRSGMSNIKRQTVRAKPSSKWRSTTPEVASPSHQSSVIEPSPAGQPAEPKPADVAKVLPLRNSSADLTARRSRSFSPASGIKSQAASAYSVYPSWWGHAEAVAAKSDVSAPPRNPPRLAYSRQQSAHDPSKDDLVTTKYLRVSSSGYAQKRDRASHDPSSTDSKSEAVSPVSADSTTLSDPPANVSENASITSAASASKAPSSWPYPFPFPYFYPPPSADGATLPPFPFPFPYAYPPPVNNSQPVVANAETASAPVSNSAPAPANDLTQPSSTAVDAKPSNPSTTKPDAAEKPIENAKSLTSTSSSVESSKKVLTKASSTAVVNKPLYLKNVQSKLKEQLEADRARYKRQMEHRKQAIIDYIQGNGGSSSSVAVSSSSKSVVTRPPPPMSSEWMSTLSPANPVYTTGYVEPEQRRRMQARALRRAEVDGDIVDGRTALAISDAFLRGPMSGAFGIGSESVQVHATSKKSQGAVSMPFATNSSTKASKLEQPRAAASKVLNQEPSESSVLDSSIIDHFATANGFVHANSADLIPSHQFSPFDAERFAQESSQRHKAGKLDSREAWDLGDFAEMIKDGDSDDEVDLRRGHPRNISKFNSAEGHEQPWFLEDAQLSRRHPQLVDDEDVDDQISRISAEDARVRQPNKSDLHRGRFFDELEESDLPASASSSNYSASPAAHPLSMRWAEASGSSSSSSSDDNFTSSVSSSISIPSSASSASSSGSSQTNQVMGGLPGRTQLDICDSDEDEDLRRRLKSTTAKSSFNRGSKGGWTGDFQHLK